VANVLCRLMVITSALGICMSLPAMLVGAAGYARNQPLAVKMDLAEVSRLYVYR
jgi:hypothetical protein